MLLFLAGVSTAVFALGAWWIISRIVAILRVLQAHAERLEVLTVAAEDTAAGLTQVREDLGDLTRRAIAVPPEHAYGVEGGSDEDPADG